MKLTMSKLKIIHHVPTESFGFTEVEQEVGGLLDEEMVSYEDVKASVMPKTASTSEYASTVEGLPHLDWNKVLDGYLTVGTMPSEVYEKMSKVQQGVIQEIKKHFKRVNKND